MLQFANQTYIIRLDKFEITPYYILSTVIIYGAIVPRPNMKEQRRVEILEAFENCVARYGVEGATLERTAGEAGLARALIRHNVGNRDDLLAALIERFFDRSAHDMGQMIAALPVQNRSRTLVDWLFDPTFSDPKQVLITEALIAAAANDKALANRLKSWTNDFVGSIESVLQQGFPNASTESIAAVGAGITGIYFNIDSFALLGPMKKLRAASKAAALRLVDSLENEK